jgi:ABC-type transport system involved in cytochrome c biogenesis permease subunit
VPRATGDRERPWIALWELALLLLALAVVLLAVDRRSFADGLAVAFIAVMTGAVMLLFADARRRRRCGAPPR